MGRAKESEVGQLPRLPRACRERPRCRAAEQRDELAAFHSATSLAGCGRCQGLPKDSTSRCRRSAALRDFNPAYDGFGSSSTHAVEATRLCLSALLRKRPSQTKM